MTPPTTHLKDSFDLNSLVRTPCVEFSMAELAEIVTTGFEDYVVPMKMDAAGFHGRFALEDIDFLASSVYRYEHQTAAVVLIARRGWTSHLSGMGVALPFRRRGVGRWVMQNAIEDARNRKDLTMLLEVIQQNPAAVQLYESLGFQKTTALFGAARPAIEFEGKDRLEEVDLVSICHQLAQQGPERLPWLFSPDSLVAKSHPTVGLSLDGDCFAIVQDTPRDVVILWSLLTLPEARRQGKATEILDEIQKQYKGKQIRFTACCPEPYLKDFFEKRGFVKDPISQFEMELKLI